MKIKTLKALSLVVLTTAFFLPTNIMASQQPTEEEQKNPTVPQKVGRETARVIGQADKAGRDVAHGFKHQRHKDKNKDKTKK